MNKKYLRAVDDVHESSLNIGKLVFDSSVKDYADTLNAQVYKQIPVKSAEAVLMGSEITLYLSVDPLKDSEIASAQRRRRQRSWEEMNKTLSGSDNYMASSDETSSEGGTGVNNSSIGGTSSTGSTASYNSHSDNATYDNSRTTGSEDEPEKVVKKTKQVSIRL